MSNPQDDGKPTEFVQQVLREIPTKDSLILAELSAIRAELADLKAAVLTPPRNSIIITGSRVDYILDRLPNANSY